MANESTPSIKNHVNQILKALQSGSILMVSGDDGTLTDCKTGTAGIIQ